MFARLYDGTDVCYTDLLAEGIVTKLLSAFNSSDQSLWPVRQCAVVSVPIARVLTSARFWQPDFCAVVALEVCDSPDDAFKDFFDPHSSDRQRRALCCLFLDNLEWMEKQRQIVAFVRWAKRWAKLSCVYVAWHAWLCCVSLPLRRLDAQDELMVGRRTSSAAGTKRSARLRARDRRSAAPQLQAPLVYPPEDTDAVTVTNADLLRCALTVCAGCSAALMPARWRRLEVSEFLNDSLVDFALKRLQEQLAQRLTPAEYEVRACLVMLACCPFARALYASACSASSTSSTASSSRRCSLTNPLCGALRNCSRHAFAQLTLYPCCFQAAWLCRRGARSREQVDRAGRPVLQGFHHHAREPVAALVAGHHLPSGRGRTAPGRKRRRCRR